MGKASPASPCSFLRACPSLYTDSSQKAGTALAWHLEPFCKPWGHVGGSAGSLSSCPEGTGARPRPSARNGGPSS